MKASVLRLILASFFALLVVINIVDPFNSEQTTPSIVPNLTVTKTQSDPSIQKSPSTSTPLEPSSGASVTTKQPKEESKPITLLPQELYPGDVIYIESTVHQSIHLWDKKYDLQPVDEKFIRFIPIPMETKPGTYPIQSTTKQKIATVQIKAKEFAVDAITVSKQMDSMRYNTKRINSDQQKINKARSNSSSKPYFRGNFVIPVVGEETTPYGYRREVNKKAANPHLAIDIANVTGTPVVASHNGKVVLADTMYLNGNMIILDHGLRVYSTYSHLSQINVKNGELVKRGQIIGKVGTTGFSTGPHLHYAMLIGNTFVNPNSFFSHPFLK